jgi:hypothetical protein
MHSLVWALISITSVVVIIFVLALLKVDITDIIFSMLSGSFVGAGICLLALSKGVNASRTSQIMFSCVLSSAIGWAASVTLLKITTLNIFGNTALAFDLVIGIIVSLSVGAHMLEHKSSKEFHSTTDHDLFK